MPPTEPDVLLRQLDGLHLVGVATTHRHGDHLQALRCRGRGHRGNWRYAGSPDAAAVTEATGVTCREVWDGDVDRARPGRA